MNNTIPISQSSKYFNVEKSESTSSKFKGRSVNKNVLSLITSLISSIFKKCAAFFCYIQFEEEDSLPTAKRLKKPLNSKVTSSEPPSQISPLVNFPLLTPPTPPSLPSLYGSNIRNQSVVTIGDGTSQHTFRNAHNAHNVSVSQRTLNGQVLDSTIIVDGKQINPGNSTKRNIYATSSTYPSDIDI